MKKRLLGGGLIVLAVVLGALFSGRMVQRPPDAVQPRGGRQVAVETTPVSRMDLPDTGLFSGSLVALSEYIVAPKVAGRLEKILLDIGDRISPEQLVAVLDSEEYSRQVEQAEAELEVAQANLSERRATLENARLEYERTVALFAKRIASQSQLDSAKADYATRQAQMRVAEAQLNQKKAALAMAKVRLSYTRIRVADGSAGHRVVGERFVDEGAMLAANTPIVSIVEIGTLKAIVNVIERDYPKIKPGMKAVVRADAFPGKDFPGRVARVSPVLKEQSREARVEVEIPNGQELLKPGMFVRVAIEFGRHAGAVVVPLQGLVKRNGETGVFLTDADDKTARFVPVQTGIAADSLVEVLSPALEGSVVTLGQHLLEDGSPILVTGRRSGGKDGRGP